MATNYNPRTVTDGLVLALDAGNTKSYPGSGTTWTDLSGNGNNGSLVNMDGANLDSANGGSLTFDGSNEYASIPYSSTLDFTDELTVSIWYYSGSAVRSFLYLKGRTDTDKYNPLLYSDGVYGWTGPLGISQRSFYFPPSNYILPNTWYNLTVTHVSGSDPIIYKNAIASTAYTYGAGSGSNPLGTNPDPVGINADIPRGLITSFDGKIANIKVYDRALSAAEVEQNFNALRGRFGI